jgi:Uma2 family endonuclease
MDAPLHLNIEALPCNLVWDRPVSDDQLSALCAANDVFQFERTKDGEIRVNQPTELSTSDGNAEIIHQLRLWWKTHRRGKVADSNGGFFLKDGSMLSPDAAYLSPETLTGIPPAGVRGLPHLCPDFVIELLSRSDSFLDTQEKMQDWIANGAALGWLIDPYKQQVLVYSPGADTETVTGIAIQGSGPVEGFTLDLTEVWRCYE